MNSVLCLKNMSAKQTLGVVFIIILNQIHTLMWSPMQNYTDNKREMPHQFITFQLFSVKNSIRLETEIKRENQWLVI